jgi:hypothetical protein
MNEQRNLTIPVIVVSAGIVVSFQLILIALKGFGAIGWGWGWVLWPMFLTTILAFISLVVALLIHFDSQ